MTERALYFDVEREKWCSVEDTAIASKEIEDLPIAVIVRCGEKLWGWCVNHKRFEVIAEINGMMFRSRDGCTIYGLPAYIHYDEKHRHESYNIPVRWRLAHESDTPTVFTGRDIANINMVRMNVGPFYWAPRIPSFKYKNCVYDLSQGTINCMRYIGELPKEVANSTLDFLKDVARDLYGIRPSNIFDNETVDAFMFRPFDMNCYALKGYFGNMDFVSRDEKNAYHLFCEKLNISPPKSLKKIYARNPFSIIQYRALLELGFNDYNLMLPFFEDTLIGQIDFSTCHKFDFPFFNETRTEIEDDEWMEYRPTSPQTSDMITQEEIDRLINHIGVYYTNHVKWNRLQFLVSWMIREKGEGFVARRLLRLSKREIPEWQKDICRMLVEYFGQLSHEVRRMFLLNGFSHVLHEALVEEINRIEFGHEKIDYFPKEVEWECEINGFQFKLPNYTDEIGVIGKKLHNCVSSYIGRSVKKDCTILSVCKGEAFVACIEIARGGTAVKQALGYHNRWLTGELLHVVNHWLRRMELKNLTDHLQDDEYENLPEDYFSYKRLVG